MHQSHNYTNYTSQGKRLLWVSLLNIIITVAQIIGGLISNSLSLLSDALHNLGDSSAIFVAFLAGKKGRKAPDHRNTFGYTRIEILAAFVNCLVLIAISVFLFVEAGKRLLNPSQVEGTTMLVAATLGLMANLAGVILLHHDKKGSLNVNAAYLHLLGDTLSSVAVIIGALAIMIFEVYWIDPVITFLVGVYIIRHTWGVLKSTVDILMQATPHDLDLNEIKKVVEAIPEVDNIHHIHAWRLNENQKHVEFHVELMENVLMTEMMDVRAEIERVLHDKFDVEHVTLQMEYRCFEYPYKALICK